jgi:flagellar basal body-associated protein FliL
MATKTADDAPGKGQGGKNKKLLLGLAAVAALGGAYKFVLAPKPPAEAEAGDVAAEVAPVEGEILELPELVINLADPETRYARIGLALVLEEGVLAEEFELEAAIAKDVALGYLSSFTYAQLRDPAVKQQAKDELSHQIRAAYGDEKVVRVLWTVLVMQ